jgi:23S rRNA (guanosine2251-2'-O)-methyltransferase
MPAKTYKIFECDNPDCGLRSFGDEHQPRWNRCPACRSTIRIIALIDKPKQDNQPEGLNIILPFEVLLDNIRSAFNVGSIFRTCDGIGIHKIHLGGITSSPDNPKVKKTSLGAEMHVSWEKCNNGLTHALQLKSHGYELWAMEEQPGSEPLFNMEFQLSEKPIIIILGNEVHGIDPGIIKISDRVINIPMYGGKGSYNVSVAFAITAGYLLSKYWQQVQM